MTPTTRAERLAARKPGRAPARQATAQPSTAQQAAPPVPRKANAAQAAPPRSPPATAAQAAPPATAQRNGRAAKPLPPAKRRQAPSATPRGQQPPTRPVQAIPGDVTPIPDPPAGHRIVELQAIIPDRAWVRILEDESEHTFLYQVLEPPLGKDETAVVEFLRDTLIRTLDGRKGREGEWEAILLEAIRQTIVDHGIRITPVSLRRIEYHLVRDFLGFGPIDVLMRDGQIEDISCDGPEIPLYLFHRKYESLKTNVVFGDEYELDSFVIRLAQRSRKHISVADPLLDATLPDGSRLQATLSREVTTRGSSFTIRKFRADPMTPPDLVKFGTLSAEMAGWFWFAMELGASFVLAGGTASGKTTSLNAISQFIPPEKKIVSIEDTREINLSHENWIAGVTRSGFGGEIRAGKQAGSIDMYKLLEAALRQRPEYLLVGEVRGPEALTLFQAMATGHAVYSTMHADSVQSAVYRLENPPINVPRMMLQTLDLVAIQAQVRTGERMTRRIREITEIVGFDPDSKELLTNTVFEWDPATDIHHYLGKSYVLEQLMEARNMTDKQVETEWRNRVEVIEWMGANDIRKVADVARVVSGYYRDPQKFLRNMRAGIKPADLVRSEPAPAPAPPATGPGHQAAVKRPREVIATPTRAVRPTAEDLAVDAMFAKGKPPAAKTGHNKQG